MFETEKILLFKVIAVVLVIGTFEFGFCFEFRYSDFLFRFLKII